VIDAMAGNDTVDAGAGSDTITGGTGNDTLTGGPGDDTYVFNAGDGIDTINDTSEPGEGNTVQFGQGIDPASLNLDLGSLLIHVGVNGDALHLTTFDSDNVLGPRTIETFRFADGTALSYDQLVQRGFDLTGAAGSETIIGTNMTDRITGLAGHDVLDGRAGGDVLAGGPGDDMYVVENVGDLVIENFNEGIDTVQSSIDYTLGMDIEHLTLTGTAALSGGGNTQNNQVTGNSGNNLLDGATGSDHLVGGDGDDTLKYSADGSWTTGFIAKNSGSPGYAGTGQTVVLNGKNRSFDVFQGDAGADRLEGTAGADALALDDPFSPFPQAAGPRLSGIEKIDVGDGNDVVDLTSRLYVYGDVTLIGGSGDDVLWANAGNDLLEGGTGNDNLYGGAGSDRLAGGDGNDTLDGGASADRLLGGLGNDSYLIDDIGDDVVEFANEGTDTVKSLITYRLGDHLENLILTGTSAINATGNSGNNTLTGNSAANALSGGLGNDIYVVGEGDVIVEGIDEGTDTVQSSQTWMLADQVENLILTGTAAINGTGNRGNNTLTGNSAVNVLAGGQGDDIYVVSVGDLVFENLNEGLDTVQSAQTWVLAVNVERLTLTGSAVSDGTGNELNNVLTGNSAANVLIGNAGDDMLNGGAGTDTLLGGTGNDIYVVDNAGDVVVEQVNEGTDLVQSSVSYVLSANIENLTLTGTSAINATGNSLVNTLTGNTGANVLDGGAGADTLIGGAGNDTYIVDDASDVVSEGAGQGADTVQSAITYILGADVENLTLTGAVAINGMGNVLNNVLTGNSAANILAGGAGNDTYVVSTGDTVVESVNEGTDTVQSNVTWTLEANLENLTLAGTAVVDGAGNSMNNTLTGNSAANRLAGGLGDDTLRGGQGNDIYFVSRGEGRDLISENDATAGNSDLLLYGAGINPLDLVLSRQANDLRLAVHGTTDRVTIQNWFSAPTAAQVESIQAGNEQALLSTQVDQLIQAMATFTQQTGLTWDQAIDQRPQDVETILAASWQ
jgi:Ca2+-binding RTX toxin-like protein